MKIIKLLISAASVFAFTFHAQAMNEDQEKDHFDFITKNPQIGHKVSSDGIQRFASTDETSSKTNLQVETLFREFQRDLGFRAYLLKDFSKQADEMGVTNSERFIGFVNGDVSTNNAVRLASSLKSQHPDVTKSERLYDLRKAQNNLKVYEDVVLSARKMLDIALREGTKQTLLCLGRTACLPHIALQETLKIRPQENVSVVHASFSGHPDALSLRTEEQANRDNDVARDIVTPKNLALYLKYLESLNLHEASVIKIVDMMESGAGLNAFMRVYYEFCRSKGKQPAHLELLQLTTNPRFENTEDVQLYDPQTFQPLPKSVNVKFWDHRDGVIHFRENQTLNVKPYSIKVTPIFIGRTTLHTLDYAEYQSFLYHGKLFPACRWTEEWLNKLNMLSPTQEACQTFLRGNFKNTIEWHEKKIGEMK